MVNLTEKQKRTITEILTKDYNEILLDGGSRSGKTFLIVFVICFLANIYKMRVLIARLRFSHAKSSLWLQTLVPFLEAEYKGHFNINKSDFIITFDNGSEIWLGGLDDKERTDKILGQEYSIIYLNEAADIMPSTIEKVKTRLAQRNDINRQILFLDCNPKSPQHYLYKRYIERNNIGTSKIFRESFVPEDNVANLPPNYIESHLENLTGSTKERFRYGRWVNIEGAIYKNLKEQNIIDCNRDLLHYQDVSIGIDFGYYSAITVWGIKDGNKAYLIFENQIVDGTTKNIIDFLDTIPFAKKYMIYADHELDRISEIQNAGYMIKKAYKEVAAGDSTVNNFELFFNKNCKDTYYCMQNMIYLQDSSGNFTEKHVKENDHLSDSCRYSLHGWKMDNMSSTNAMVVLGRVI